jgi:hypothetical protein
MKIVSKPIIPNKEFIIKTEQGKIGSIAKNKKGYLFLQKGRTVSFKDIREVKQQFGFNPFENSAMLGQAVESSPSIYNYPCSSKPHSPIFNVKKRLPIFSKSAKSKSQYCAGYYIIKFKKGWVRSFCPKLITLERYPYYGPFKTESESKLMLSKIGQIDEKVEYFAD